MIAKRADEKKEFTGSYTGLAKYILRADKKETIAAGWVTNCGFEDYPAAINEINAVQAMNTRGNENAKTYHLVVSFPAGEKPSIETLKAIEDELCKKIGLGDHQRISAVHDDTDHYHLHIAINKVHPQSHNLTEPYYDKKKLVEAAKELEIKHNLRKEIDWENPKGINHQKGRGDKSVKVNSKARDMEAHTGALSFHSWVQDKKPDLLPKVQAATNWQDLHKTLAQYDLTIRPHANGLSISSRTQKAYIKASDFDRNTTLKKLEDRFGKYQPPTPSIKDLTPVLQYKLSPKQTGKAVNTQFAIYQQQQQSKKAALEAIKEARKQASAKLAKDYQERRESIKKDRLLNIKFKRRTYQLLKQTYQQDKVRLSTDFKQQSDAIYQQHPAKNWQDWLIHQATQGDKPALDTLRQNKPANSKPVERFAVWGEQEKQGMHLLKRLQPKVQKNGDILYQAMGVKIRDTGKRLALDSNQEAAIITALRLAQSKYGNHLDVQGDVEFKQKVVEAAVATGMNVTFADPDMEHRRRALKQQQPQEPTPTKPKTRTQNKPTKDQGR
ncbi:MAG: hypothetical protein BWK73_10385 [Thiothrix lacustris]|uniref:Uncharacterized protein n=1 Tax=Thiothrix lacustris TaxID=525917 RepID=A0A1Y1QUC0_9GAMM|nr:MAG: hypothetical protein BWK73_10385 [Thiothrix lacustris]